jgi:excisionase family DNA binding protein
MPTLASIPSSAPLCGPEWASAYLGVPVKTLYEWRYRGIGPPSYRVGRHIRYRKAEVDAWLAERHLVGGDDAA